MTTYTYVIGEAGSSAVKIGMSNTPERRLREIQAHSPVRVTILWTHPGGHPLEQALHSHFAAYRMHGEWFDFGTLDPVQTITQALSTGAVAVPEEPSAEAAPQPPPFDELALFRSTLTRLYGPGATFILWEFAEQAGWPEPTARELLAQLVDGGHLKLAGPHLAQTRLDWTRQRYEVRR
uniref:GIY-YIG nuclease family protein n=1 Tax=Streptomyces sp. CA-141956 TaxID=3240051 RepID=UPI003F49232F